MKISSWHLGPVPAGISGHLQPESLVILSGIRYRHKLPGRFHIVEALYQSLDAFFIRPAQLQQLTDLIRDTYTLQLEFSLGRVKI